MDDHILPVRAGVEAITDSQGRDNFKACIEPAVAASTKPA